MTQPTPEQMAAAIAHARRYRAATRLCRRQFQQHLESQAEKLRENFINFIVSRMTEEQDAP